jgi:hypothetical protein
MGVDETWKSTLGEDVSAKLLREDVSAKVADLLIFSLSYANAWVKPNPVAFPATCNVEERGRFQAEQMRPSNVGTLAAGAAGGALMMESRTSGAFGAESEGGFGRAAAGGEPGAPTREASKTIRDFGASQTSMHKAQKTTDSLDDTIRWYIENKPYTTALIALGIGWLMGRSHNPF